MLPKRCLHCLQSQLLKDGLGKCGIHSRVVDLTCGCDFRGHYLTFAEGDIYQPSIEKREWDKNRFHFDNVAEAMLTLFTVSTFEGWPK